MSDDLRYPIGKFKPTSEPEPADRREWLRTLEEAPALLREAVAGLSDAQLDTPYREGGWTVRQVVHHVPDSHANAYVRTCLALTETEPTIRDYNEQAWAMLTFSRLGPIDVSLDMLAGLHGRWLGVMRGMSEADYSRRLIHPEKGLMTMAVLIEMYSWHGRHHVAHITKLREREGW
ncbi:MAG: putative metal-dependent hydrolase [Gemmatimonadetes bacterium]|nr:putative metal-dependent hydrolase [Gemmatimonadota bacterium]